MPAVLEVHDMYMPYPPTDSPYPVPWKMILKVDM